MGCSAILAPSKAQPPAAAPGVSCLVQPFLRSLADLLWLTSQPGSSKTWAILAFSVADIDYLVKPFELDELLARLRALRRRHDGRASTVLQVADLTLDPATREVTRGGRAVLLSSREFALLQALLERPGAIVSRAQLEDRLYGWGEELESNAISVYMHQLRKKLGDDLLHTVRGLGYYAGPAKDGSA
jgi:DNA-binding response OmpR family regulator